jgi:hypothetical protein
VIAKVPSRREFAAGATPRVATARGIMKKLASRNLLFGALRENNRSLHTIDYEVRFGEKWSNKIGCGVHVARLRSACDCNLWTST